MELKKHDLSTEMLIKKVDAISNLVKEATDEEIKIETLIRERYSMSQETKIHRKKLMGILPDDEWNAYTAYIEECIEKANEIREA